MRGWEVDEEVMKRLFALTDVNCDGVVEFGELVMLFSGIKKRREERRRGEKRRGEERRGEKRREEKENKKR